jgi:hypothetical protein
VTFLSRQHAGLMIRVRSAIYQRVQGRHLTSVRPLLMHATLSSISVFRLTRDVEAPLVRTRADSCSALLQLCLRVLWGQAPAARPASTSPDSKVRTRPNHGFLARNSSISHSGAMLWIAHPCCTPELAGACRSFVARPCHLLPSLPMPIQAYYEHSSCSQTCSFPSLPPARHAELHS